MKKVFVLLEETLGFAAASSLTKVLGVFDREDDARAIRDSLLNKSHGNTTYMLKQYNIVPSTYID